MPVALFFFVMRIPRPARTTQNWPGRVQQEYVSVHFAVPALAEPVDRIVKFRLQPE
jgi:hypothetical protein